MVLLSLSLVPTLAYAQPQGSHEGHDEESPDCKSRYDGDYIPHCDFVNADASAEGSNIPKCDGSYQDCYTEDGYFCEAGLDMVMMITDWDDGRSDDDGEREDDDNEGEGSNEDNLFGN